MESDASLFLFVSVMADRVLQTKQKRGRRPASFDGRYLRPLPTYGIVFDRGLRSKKSRVSVCGSVCHHAQALDCVLFRVFSLSSLIA